MWRIPGRAVIAALLVLPSLMGGPALASPTLGVIVSPENRARVIARQSYERMLLHPARTEVVAGALSDLTLAHDLDPDEAWIFIAASRAKLIQGYRSGDWDDVRSFDQELLAQSIVLARRALELGPREPLASVNLAGLLILAGRNPEAAALLETARRLDGDGFYPRYGEAVLLKRQGDLRKAALVLAEAAARARGSLENSLAAQEGADLARKLGDAVGEEKFLKQAIAADPGDALKQAGYADFLTARSRYAEAVAAWETAARLDPSSSAASHLAEAKRLRDLPAEETAVAALVGAKVDAAALRAKGRAVLPVLARLYERADEAGRARIAYAFYALGWKSADAKRVLMRDVRTDNADLRLQVQWALGRVSSDPDVVEALLGTMRNDPNPLFRDKAASALARDQIFLTPEQKQLLLGRLIQALRDPKPEVRALALQALSIHTGQTRGFDPNASPEQREAKVRAWERWLQEHRGGR